jgi:hypothetical protein
MLAIQKSEKEVKEALIKLLGKDLVFAETANAYGDRRKFAFGFRIKEVAKRYNAIDNAPAGYSNQYKVDITTLLENELKENGFEVINVWVGSWVHGYIHRVINMLK